MEKDIPCKWKQKESWGSHTHIRQNRLLKKIVTKDKEGHYIMIKGSVQQENITFRGIYAPNKGAPEYVKQNINRHKERNSNTITVGELYTLLTSIDKSSRQKMNRETL